MEPEVIYEDNHLLAVNKPGGLLTQPSGTKQNSLESICKAFLKRKYQKPGQVFLEAVHRLDKPVSGLVLFAKTSKALSRLNESIRSKETAKTYLALLEKAPNPLQATLEHYLIHDDHFARIAPEGKLSRLHYKTIKTVDIFTLVEITLETGRYHQIRAQFSAIGCPLAGDPKYGGTAFYSTDCIGLHHAHLQVPHPITKEMLSLEAPWEFGESLERGYSLSWKSAQSYLTISPEKTITHF